jgi:hypothetical protein
VERCEFDSTLGVVFYRPERGVREGVLGRRSTVLSGKEKERGGCWGVVLSCGVPDRFPGASGIATAVCKSGKA